MFVMRYLKISSYLEIVKSLLILATVKSFIAFFPVFFLLFDIEWPMLLVTSSPFAVSTFVFIVHFAAFFTAAYFAKPQYRVQTIVLTAFIWWLIITALNVFVYEDTVLLVAIFDLYHNMAIAVITLLIMHLFRTEKRA